MKKLLAVFVALLLVGILAVGVSAQSGSGGYFDFESSVRIMQDLLVLDDVNIQDTARVETDLTVGDDLTVNDLATVGKIRATRGATQTLTFGSVITDVATFQPISAAGAIGLSGIATVTSVAGDILILENVVNQAITISDTGITMLSGNIALGQYDTLGLVYDGTNWVQLFTTNN